MPNGERDVTLRFSQEGAQEVVQAIQGLQGAFSKFTQGMQQFNQGAPAQQRTFSSLGNVIKNLRASFQQGAAAGQGLGSALSVIGNVAKFAISPIGLLALGAGGLTAVLLKTADAAVQSYRALEQLQVTTGLGVREAQALRNAFELAGADADALTSAMFRLGIELETGGKAFEGLGINIRDQQGNLKNLSQLFNEIQARISTMSDASAQAAVAQDVFGRQGLRILQILKMQSGEWTNLQERGTQAASMTEGMAKQVQEVIKRMAELNQVQEGLNAEWAKMIGLPLKEFWVGLQTSVIGFATAATKALFNVRETMTEVFAQLEKGAEELIGPRLLSGLQRRARVMANILSFGLVGAAPPAPAVAGAAPTPGVVSGATAAQRAGERAGTVLPGLTRPEIQRETERAKITFETNQKIIQQSQQFYAAWLKLRTGSEVQALENQVGINEEAITNTEAHYDGLIKLQKRAGVQDVQAIERLEKERADRIQDLRQQSAMTTLQIEQARIVDTKRLMEDELSVVKNLEDRRRAMLDAESKRALAANELLTQNLVEQTTRRYAIEERTVMMEGQLRLQGINQQIRMQKELQAAFPENFEIQRETNQKIIELSTQRLQAEQEINTRIMEGRKELVKQLNQLAEQEANVGQQIFDRAAGRLQARGRRMVSQADIEREQRRMEREEEKAISRFGAGGRAPIETLQRAFGARGMYKELAQLGVGPGGALQQLTGATAAAMGGELGMRLPTGVAGLPPELAGAAGMGPAGALMPAITPEAMGVKQLPATFADAMKQARDAVADGLRSIAEDIGAWNARIGEDLIPRIEEAIIRRLEFQAART